ncbi:uncharacterized protein LOC134727947 [Mytilus trossulus]|uniref:uncharacterized protein LOC134727947 n=1 Tax=Mytilus trossulus TaxID=6551 RepID=UPI003005C333
MLLWIYIVLLELPFLYASTILPEKDDTNHILTVAEQFESLQQELRTMKQKLDTTIKDNILLKERVDVLSKDNSEIMQVVLETNAHLTERFDAVSEETQTIKNILNTLLEERDCDVHIPNNNEQNENEMGRSTSVSDQILLRDDEKNIHIKTHGDKKLSTKFKNEKRLLQNSFTTELPAISRVAFSAQLTGGNVQLGQHQTVGYNTVLTNIGSAYDSRHNHFIVPAKGVYLLSFTGLNVSGDSIYLEMVKNGNQIALVYCSPTTNNMGSQMIVEVLEKGDVVWVRHHASGGPAQVDGINAYNTFSGVLLFAI